MQIVITEPTQLNLVKLILQAHNITVESSLPDVTDGLVINLENKSDIEALGIITSLKTNQVAFEMATFAESYDTPAPYLASIDPASHLTVIGSGEAPQVTVQVTGKDFSNPAKVFHGSQANPDKKLPSGAVPRPTSYLNPTSLSYTLNPSDLQPAGDYDVFVKNLDGQVSNTVTFTTSGPPPENIFGGTQEQQLEQATTRVVELERELAKARIRKPGYH
jgi:hypothetical protein